jgi:hypothetical protein
MIRAFFRRLMGEPRQPAEPNPTSQAPVPSGEPLPVVELMPDGGRCYFKAIVSLRQRRGDDIGVLLMSDKGAFFDGDRFLTLPWSTVLTISSKDCSLTIHRTRGGEPAVFELRAPDDRKLARFVANHLLDTHQRPLRPTRMKAAGRGVSDVNIDGVSEPDNAGRHHQRHRRT